MFFIVLILSGKKEILHGSNNYYKIINIFIIIQTY